MSWMIIPGWQPALLRAALLLGLAAANPSPQARAVESQDSPRAGVETMSLQQDAVVTGKPGGLRLRAGKDVGAFGETRAAHAQPTSAQELSERWGIELTGFRLSAQGYFVDFRYKVIDPEKARPLADKQHKPWLLDEASGKKLAVPSTPKLGLLRQTAQALEAGKTYFMFFGNARGLVKSGSRVTVVIGDCRIEHLTVE